MDPLLNSGALLEILGFLIIIVLIVWRVPSKGDINSSTTKSMHCEMI